MQMSTWRGRALHRRAERALALNILYQKRKARTLAGQEQTLIARMREHSRAVFSQVEKVRALSPDARVLEVGSGAHGLIFFFPGMVRVGVDPVAVEYAPMFPRWQRAAQTCAAFGEHLPFADSSFDVVLCDNVIDHAEGPAQIVRELVRVLKRGGVLYFTVNVHHPIYHAASILHGAWTAAGVPFEIQPFANHTVHLTPDRAREIIRSDDRAAG